MNDIHIRPASPEDLPALAALLHAINLFAWINDQPLEETLQTVRRHFHQCQADDSHSTYVAEDGQGQLTGYVSIHWLPYLILAGPEGYVSELFISPGARGQGIGSALLDTAVQEGRRRGCTRMTLINMRQRESYQRGFYKKQGWEENTEAARFVLRL